MLSILGLFSKSSLVLPGLTTKAQYSLAVVSSHFVNIIYVRTLFASLE
jgi:hypothetical protein